MLGRAAELAPFVRAQRGTDGLPLFLVGIVLEAEQDLSRHVRVQFGVLRDGPRRTCRS